MRKKLGKAAVTILVLSVFSFMALGSGSSSSEPTKVGEVSEDETKDKTEKEDTKPGTAADSTGDEEPQQEKFYVGDKLKADGLEIVYVASGEYVEDNMFMQPKDGNKYIYIELAAENVSDHDETISLFSFDAYADGYSCEAFWGTDDGLSASLSAGRTASGKVCFEVPKDATEIEIEYEYNIFSSKKAIFVYEGEKDSGYVMEQKGASDDAYKIGDIIEGDGIRMTYVSADVWKSDNMFVEPKDGNEFIECVFEFENISDYDTTVSTFGFNCYADGKACDQCLFNDNDISTVSLSSGRKAKGSVTFEVPKDAEVVELEFDTNYFLSKHIVFTVR